MIPILQKPHLLRALQLILVAIVLMAIGIPQPAHAATAEVVAAHNLNLRSCPTLECDIVATAPLGAAVEVTGVAVNGFLPVRHNGTDGWAYRLFLQTSSTAPWFTEASAACAPKVGFVFNIGIGYTPSQTILNTLITEDVVATMFPMGSFARTQPAYLQQLATAGFPIGTHGDQNRLLTDVSDGLMRQDTLDSVAAIEAVIGRPIDQIHTPYAADNDNRVRSIVSDLGLLPVGWTIGANDYSATATEEAVCSRIMTNVYPGAVITSLPPGTLVTVRGAAVNGWTPVRCAGVDGWMSSAYLTATSPTSPTPTPTATSTPTGSTGTVVNTGGTTLRCRTGAGTGFAIITSLAPGSTVPVRGAPTNGWVPVSCGGRDGWVSADYLRINS